MNNILKIKDLSKTYVTKLGCVEALKNVNLDIKDGEIIGKGSNHVLANNDPTAHAEVMAIRDACKNINSYDLSGCELYTSCYPCPMCLSAIIWANIKKVYYGNTKEDAANILPLGMDTKIVWKINLRALMHFMNLRLCTRAYKEIRTLSNELKDKLRILSPEWEWICDNLFVPKCEAVGYCDEAKSCGKKITKSQMLEAIELWKKTK